MPLGRGCELKPGWMFVFFFHVKVLFILWVGMYLPRDDENLKKCVVKNRASRRQRCGKSIV